MNKKVIAGVGGVALLVVGFFGGMAYGKVGTSPQIPMGNGQFAGGPPGGQGGGVRGGMNSGGFAAGEIISKDASSITIKMQDGSTKIILVGESTQVLKSTTGSQSDLVEGTTVTVTGTANSDGSITGQSVQIRPAGAPAPTRATQ